MALIKCPDCGGKMSDTTLVCVHCGCRPDLCREMSFAEKAALWFFGLVGMAAIVGYFIAKEMSK